MNELFRLLLFIRRLFNDDISSTIKHEREFESVADESNLTYLNE